MIKSRIFWYWNTDTNLYLRTYVSTFRILCRSVFLQNNHWTSFSRHSSYTKVQWSYTSRQIAIDCVDDDPLTSNIRQVLKLKILVIQSPRFMMHRHGGPVMQLPMFHIGEQSSSRPYCNVTPMILITCQRGQLVMTAHQRYHHGSATVQVVAMPKRWIICMLVHLFDWICLVCTAKYYIISSNSYIFSQFW